jgi:hypothetical protein
MKWPDLVAAIFEELDSSAVLAAVFGAAITDLEERAFSVPSIRVNLVSNIETENYEPSVVQFSVFTRRKQDQIIAEAELRRLFHRSTPYVLQGVGTWSQYEGRTRLAGPQDGIQGVAVDFRFEPLRTRYTPAAGS